MVSWPGWVGGVVVFPIVRGRVRVCEAASRGFLDCRRGYPGGSVGPKSGVEWCFAIEMRTSREYLVPWYL